MDRSLRNLLGMLDEGKRIYKFVDGEVTREEYEYCQVLDQILFGEKGYVETLGPTWNMIHDPRFMKIENAFIIDRRAVFGGDAKLGKQYIHSDGTFTSTVADLEQYAEVLGEGRHFHNVLVHPNENCPTRKWLERIHTATDVKPGELNCGCTPILDPHDLKSQSDEYLWSLIKAESPNYFTKQGVPNHLATRLFDLFKEDLVGLVADYAVTPLIDEWILLETGDVVEQTNNEDLFNNPPRVFAEVDILEKALTSRALLRATAAKVLRQIGFQKTLKEMGEIKLTDIERDELLRLIYNPQKSEIVNPEGRKVTLVVPKADMATSPYGFIAQVKDTVKKFLEGIRATGKDYMTRQEEQLVRASQKSKDTISELLAGTKVPINQYTEPTVEVEQDDFAKTMEAIMADPRKQELFVIFAEAERRGQEGKTDDEKLRMRRLASVLYPVFMDAKFELTDAKFDELCQAIAESGFSDTNVMQVEEEFHG